MKMTAQKPIGIKQLVYLGISIIFFSISIEAIPQTFHILEPNPYSGRQHSQVFEIYLVNTFWIYAFLISGVILFVKAKPIIILKNLLKRK